MTTDYLVESYHYELPRQLIAQEPAARRDASRLLVLDRGKDILEDGKFIDLVDLAQPGDLLVVNNTRVFPARLLGRKESGGQVELLVLDYPDEKEIGLHADGAAGWRRATATALLKSSKRPRPGARLLFNDRLHGVVAEILADGKVRVVLHFQGDLDEVLAGHGQMPLPPYIRRESGEGAEDRTRYQTVFASRIGAVAAPTAGLHFTSELLAKMRAKGIGIASVTLHVGYGTFAPVRVEDIREHPIHAEYLAVSRETADLVNATLAAGGAVWAVGTTTVRALEFAADEKGMVQPKSGICDLYIYPGYTFKVVKNLITNFHLPRSSLLFLVSALAGRGPILRAYRHAVRNRYRFYSYGDAMAIIA